MSFDKINEFAINTKRFKLSNFIFIYKVLKLECYAIHGQRPDKSNDQKIVKKKKQLYIIKRKPELLNEAEQ